jgi:hypothetical protein
MRNWILTGSLFAIAIGAQAQGSSRIASGTPLRWGSEGSIEVMEGDLARYYGKNDTANASRRQTAVYNTGLGNPRDTRFASVQAQCSNNEMSLNWVAVQQGGSDRYELEQSSDGNNWKVVGVVLANQNDRGHSTYQYNYNSLASNVLFRIAATSISGERVTSAPFHSPCSNEAYLGVTPNPVYSNTTLRIGSPGTARVKILLVDSRGVPHYSTDANLVQGINHIPLQMNGLPIGQYSAVIRWMNGRQQVIPLVKN